MVKVTCVFCAFSMCMILWLPTDYIALSKAGRSCCSYYLSVEYVLTDIANQTSYVKPQTFKRTKIVRLDSIKLSSYLFVTPVA